MRHPRRHRRRPDTTRRLRRRRRYRKGFLTAAEKEKKKKKSEYINITNGEGVFETADGFFSDPVFFLFENQTDVATAFSAKYTTVAVCGVCAPV